MSSVEIDRVENPNLLPDIESFHYSHPGSFVYVTGSKNETGEWWCSDSEKAEDLVMNKFKQVNKNVKVLYCTVKREEYKGNPMYPYRINPILKLTAVPTLYWWNHVGELFRLVEEDCYNQEKLDAFFSKAI